MDLVTPFLLGNAAILTNVCLLPLYPGLIAFLAGNATNSDERFQRATGWLGVLVLAGILSMMTAVALLVYILSATFDGVLPVLLPVIYAVVIILGLLMLTGRNPFARLTTIQAPMMKNPYITAYLYGLLLGPMTLPCVGPLITAQIGISVALGTGLLDSLVYFVMFGIGFGWPLVLMPLFAVSAQRRFTQFLTQNYTTITRVAGVLLVFIGVFGVFTELVPNL